MGHAVPVLPASLSDERWEHLDHLISCSLTLNLRLGHTHMQGNQACMKQQQCFDVAAATRCIKIRRMTSTSPFVDIGGFFLFAEHSFHCMVAVF